MQTGICPKCHSKKIHAGKNVFLKRGDYGSNTIPIRPFSNAVLDNYVCVQCGYTESYVADHAKRKIIEKAWPKVNPSSR